jgi:hypothetical protein
MKTFAKSALVAVAISVLGAGAALAAEKCACCKEGEKMTCSDKMKDKDAAPKPDDTKPAPEHQH